MLKAYPEFNGESVRFIWPGSFHKGTAGGEGYQVEYYFCADPDRCRYSMDNVHASLGFYQWDTNQDAIYFGTWVDPAGLHILTYCEGDISLVTCHTVQDYKAYLAKMDGNLDDHDGRHWIRLEGGE